MNDKPSNNLVSENKSEEVLVNEVGVATDNTPELDGSQVSTRSTYDSLFWLLSYSKLFVYRFAKDLFISLLGYIYSGQLLPNHIVDLMNVQNNLRRENEPHTVTCSSSRTQQDDTIQLTMSKYFNVIKSYILCSEDDINLQCRPTRELHYNSVDKEPVFTIVDSNCLSNSSSKEILIDKKPKSRDTILKNYFRNNTLPINVPSTSKDNKYNILASKLKESVSNEELKMIDINLQTNNDMQVGDIDNESIVISYLRDMSSDFEGQILLTKRKSSLLESVPKMETILEGEQFGTFLNQSQAKQNKTTKEEINEENKTD